MEERLNEYCKHAVDSLIVKKNNSIKQKGKSDIESELYVDNTIVWFNKLIDLINENIPKYYIREMRIEIDDTREVLNYEYKYYEIGEEIGEMSLGISLIESGGPSE